MCPCSPVTVSGERRFLCRPRFLSGPCTVLGGQGLLRLGDVLTHVGVGGDTAQLERLPGGEVTGVHRSLPSQVLPREHGSPGAEGDYLEPFFLPFFASDFFNSRLITPASVRLLRSPVGLPAVEKRDGCASSTSARFLAFPASAKPAALPSSRPIRRGISPERCPNSDSAMPVAWRMTFAGITSASRRCRSSVRRSLKPRATK